MSQLSDEQRIEEAGLESFPASDAPSWNAGLVAEAADDREESPILDTAALGAPPWPTSDPFLACMHHEDRYPAGNERLGPSAPLQGRRIGSDFEGKDGWRMYHGELVPGFPQHPHRGFETVTVVRKGYVDHADSMGATARYGEGDTQWLTAGSGVVHSEMFPLLQPDGPNPLELFQIWLNLPASAKLSPPRFAMFWAADIPRSVFGPPEREIEVVQIAGALNGQRAPSPPPDSWAARAENDVAIWTIRMQAGADWLVPAATGNETERTLYFHRGGPARIAGTVFPSPVAVALRAGANVRLTAGGAGCEFLLLQGRPIREPVAQHGPFVMNREAEIHQALADYRRTRFGGWPFRGDAPVHDRGAGRFARYADGRIERPQR